MKYVNRNRTKQNVSCLVCCKGRAGNMLSIMSVTEQRSVFHTDYGDCDYRKEPDFQSPSFFFPMKILPLLLHKRLCGSQWYAQPYRTHYCGTTWSTLLLYNHALSNTNLICFTFDPRERSWSSQWVGAVRREIDCWQQRRPFPSPELFTDWEFLMVQTDGKVKTLSCISCCDTECLELYLNSPYVFTVQ